MSLRTPFVSTVHEERPSRSGRSNFSLGQKLSPFSHFSQYGVAKRKGIASPRADVIATVLWECCARGALFVTLFRECCARRSNLRLHLKKYPFL